jgi:hypothetical protein
MNQLNYQARIARALQSLNLSPGTIAVANVQHDHDCPGARGCPVCNCQPDIRIKTPTGTVAVLADGSIRPTANLN